MSIFKKKDPSKPKVKKSKTREWVDAIIFALVFSTIIRGLLFSAYAIPSGSMERSLLIGDYLFVSKMSYGARMPFTPVSVPFLEAHYGSTKTYWDGINLGYHRLPGLGKIKRNDVVVFNDPKEGDFPVDMRVHLIKRCMGIPGDKLEVVNGQVIVNGKPAGFPAEGQTSYEVVTDGSEINPLQIRDLNIDIMQQLSENTFEMTMPAATVNELKRNPVVKSIKPQIKPKGEADLQVYPHDKKFAWNQDNYGPVTIPAKGTTVTLDSISLPLYRRVIELYEGNKLEEQGNRIVINGQQTDKYTFKMDYYWMMGDNRHNSLDSRFWGFVPEDHIVGKAIVVAMSTDQNAGFWSKFRWNRVFTKIR